MECYFIFWRLFLIPYSSCLSNSPSSCQHSERVCALHAANWLQKVVDSHVQFACCSITESVRTYFLSPLKRVWLLEGGRECAPRRVGRNWLALGRLVWATQREYLQLQEYSHPRDYHQSQIHIWRSEESISIFPDQGIQFAEETSSIGWTFRPNTPAQHAYARLFIPIPPQRQSQLRKILKNSPWTNFTHKTKTNALNNLRPFY